MHALGLVRISKKPNFVDITCKKSKTVKKWGWAVFNINGDFEAIIWPPKAAVSIGYHSLKLSKNKQLFAYWIRFLDFLSIVQSFYSTDFFSNILNSEDYMQLFLSLFPGKIKSAYILVRMTKILIYQGVLICWSALALL